MALLTLQNFNPYMMFFSQEKLSMPIALVNEMILKIIKSPNLIFLYERFRKYDHITFVHSLNVSLLSILLAQDMEYQGKFLSEIAWGALLHDLGKLNVPKSILNKPERLSLEEYNLIKKHPEYGMELVEPFDLSVNIQMVIAQHHERWGGTGYPLGLKAQEIHPHAQIVAVADTFDALISDRPYRNGIEFDQAIEIIKAGKRKNFSPRVVDHLLKLLVL